MSDEAARRRIVGELEINMLVEASAGTGKTSSLVDRIAALVSTGVARMSEIAAVTFTRKAASQLRDRLRMRLDRDLRLLAAGAPRERVAAARDEIDRAFLGTIHAFCARLLRERPVEAGVSPDFVEPEEDEAAALRDASWLGALERLERTPASAELVDLGISSARLSGAFRDLCEYPDVAAVAEPVAPPDFSEALSDVFGLLDEIVPVLEDLGRAGAPDKFAADLWTAHYRRRIQDLSDPAAAGAFLAIFAKPEITQYRWPDGVGKKLSDRMKSLAGKSIEPTLSRWYAHRHAPVVRFLSGAADAFRAERLEAGRPGFTDLLMLCRDMLRDHPSVRRHFRERYPRLLVDEFQDTDPVQAEVMLLLTASDLAERDWKKTVPRPGALFVVGDPKQSIYRFRRADIETYQRVRGILERSGGGVVELRQSFRSRGEICAFVNGVFAENFAPGLAHQAEDVPLEASRTPVAATLPAGPFALVSPVVSDKHPPAWEADARAVARWIAAAIAGPLTISVKDGERERARPVTPGDFLVILRNTARLDMYARALEAEGVPTAVAGGKAFRDSEEVRAFVPLLQALADPDDPVPILAFLRGPYTGVDDDALYRFKAAGGRFAFRADLPAESDPRIASAFDRIREADRVRRALPPGAAVGRIAASLGIVPGAYARDVGERRAGNLQKALLFARRLSVEGRAFSEIVEALTDLLESAEAPEMTIDPVKENAVRITNLHKAKGLEAPVVFLAGPVGDTRREGADVWIDRDADPPRGHFLVRDDSGAEVARPVAWDDYRSTEKEHRAAEDLRLLYVAATRAMNTLVVSGRINTGAKKPKPSFGPWKDLASASLPDLPPLPDPVRRSDPAPPIDPGQFPAAVRAIDESRSRAALPTFAVATPSKFEGAGGFVKREASGKGMAWGRILHRLLEAAMRGAGDFDARRLGANLLRFEERDPDELSELMATLDGVLASDLWRRAKASPSRLVEVPFATVVRSRDYGLPDPPGETLLNGVIDLVFREDGIWKLIDWKSDTVVGPIGDLVAFYAPQLRAYRNEWEHLTGEKTEAALCFIASGAVEWLPS